MHTHIPGHRRHKVFQTILPLVTLLLLISFSGPASAHPPVLDAGVSTNQHTWDFNPPLKNNEVKFWMRVQREGNLSRFGTFDYYFNVQVVRPDGTDVWNTLYGFNQQGYAEQAFSLPALFYERSADRAAPSFGTWKIRVALVEKDTQRAVSAKEFAFNFVDGRSVSNSPPATAATASGKPFPVPLFSYKKWKLKDWGIGIYDEKAIGPDSYDKEIVVSESRKSFSVKEVMAAWQNGHKFGAWLTGPSVSTYRDSNNFPIYLFGYILHRPNGDADGKNPQYRQNSYCNNPGTAGFSFDLRQPGTYRLEYLLRERDKNSWEEASWVSIGSIEFTLAE